MPTKTPNETVPMEVPGEKHEQGHSLTSDQQQQGGAKDRQRQQGGQPNEGEGNRTAARHYNTGAQQSAQHPGRTERQAEAAKRAVDGPEGTELARAEEAGKKPARR
ncbi:hypothetical protein [Dongia sp.]|uniref:hypothetical protein n=1 Tax=Dongia sp. TaxID=1977262 RepID=UPI0035B1E99D